MFITKKHLSRRTFLRGTFGAAIALPFLDAMVPSLTAQSSTAAAGQFRFAGVYIPNGVLVAQWHPSAVGRDFEFVGAMRPLEPFREHLVTVSGLVGSGTPGPHLGCSCGWLNGVGAVGKEGEPILSGKTLDQLIVDRIGQETTLPSLELGTEDMGSQIGSCDGYACLYFSAMSWKTDTQPLPIEINPRTTFERMFGEAGSDGRRRARLEFRNSILDSVTDEAARLERSLGPEDRAVLGEYLTNLREVEQRIQRIMQRSAQNGDVPAAPAGVPESFEEHMAVTYDLMHLAFQGDITRVITFLTGVEASNRGYPFVGVSESHHHCSHHGDDATQMQKYTTIVTWQTAQFARFVEKMKNTRDGDGTLLDHSLLYFGGGMSNGNQHDRNNPPAVLVGGANGKLQGNNHVAANRAPSVNLLLNIAEMADVRLEKIGNSNGRISL